MELKRGPPTGPLQRRAGSKAQPVRDGQLLLAFGHELAEKAQERLETELKESEGEPEEQAMSTEEAVGRRRRLRGRRPLPMDLPRVRSVCELEGTQRRCSCGEEMPEIGEVISEELLRLDMLFVHQHADGQIVALVVVEVARGERVAELGVDVRSTGPLRRP